MGQKINLRAIEIIRNMQKEFILLWKEDVASELTVEKKKRYLQQYIHCIHEIWTQLIIIFSPSVIQDMVQLCIIMAN